MSTESERFSPKAQTGRSFDALMKASLSADKAAVEAAIERELASKRKPKKAALLVKPEAPKKKSRPRKKKP